MNPPNTSSDFDRVYRSSLLHWMWSDIRIPKELKRLVQQASPQRALELGCGVGRFSDYLAQRGVQTTGVDFSPVAIQKARERSRHRGVAPEFLVGDVTHLEALSGPFDILYDIGCFHCLDPQGQRSYAAEVARLLRPGGTHLIWAMDSPPSGIPLSPAVITAIFAPNFRLQNASHSRRRFARSHWYWLTRPLN